MTDTQRIAADEERVKRIRERLATDQDEYPKRTVEFLVSIIDRQAAELTRLRAIEDATRAFMTAKRDDPNLVRKMLDLQALLTQEPQP